MSNHLTAQEELEWLRIMIKNDSSVNVESFNLLPIEERLELLYLRSHFLNLAIGVFAIKLGLDEGEITSLEKEILSHRN